MVCYGISGVVNFIGVYIIIIIIIIIIISYLSLSFDIIFYKLHILKTNRSVLNKKKEKKINLINPL